MVTTEDYFNRFIELLKQNREHTHEQIYNQLEDEYFTRNKKRKYKDYRTFRRMKSLFYMVNR